MALAGLHAWPPKAALGTAIAIQLLMGIWSLCADPNDCMLTVVRGLTTLLECGGTALLLALTCLAESGDGAQFKINKSLGMVSNTLLMTSVCLPIGLTMYDTIFLPFYKVQCFPLLPASASFLDSTLCQI